MRLGHLNGGVGDSSLRSEEIVNISNCAFGWDDDDDDADDDEDDDDDDDDDDVDDGDCYYGKRGKAHSTLSIS